MKLAYAFAVAAFAAAVSLPASAASHVKPGLWEVKVRTNAGQAYAMPDLSKLPPQVQAQMKARGVQMNAGGLTARHCITPAEAANDTPAMGQGEGCHVEHVKITGRSYDADMVCTGEKPGEMNARGHIQITFESPLHYFGTSTMSGTANGQPIGNATKIDARWLAADCGKMP